MAKNPNGLDLDQRHYRRGITKLYLKKEGRLAEAVFDHFEQRNGKTLIYVQCEGKLCFYFFPESNYVFPNKDDANYALVTEKRKAENGGLTDPIVRAYERFPLSKASSKVHSEEYVHEKEYHSDVDRYLQDSIELDQERIASLQSYSYDVDMAYREACIDARENGGIMDDFAMISHQIKYQKINTDTTAARRRIDRTAEKRSCPYFARIDCGRTIDSLHTAYIGDSGIGDLVYDWRNPEIGNVYYNSAMFQSRDDIVIGLKRIIEIKHAQFLDYTDEINLYLSDRCKDETTESGAETEISADELLTKLLLLSREDKRTHDIIKTIQGEQYNIITHNFDDNVLVNGCAGSGKTMIMYHRLSYMAYNYESNAGRPFVPQNVYVFSPSDYFDASNNELLEKLSIDEINHGSFYDLVEEIVFQRCTDLNIISFPFLKGHDIESITHECDIYSQITFDRFYGQFQKIDYDDGTKNDYRKWIAGVINEILDQNGFPTLSVRKMLSGSIIASEVFANKTYYLSSALEKQSEEEKCFDDQSQGEKNQDNQKKKPAKSTSSKENSFYLKSAIATVSFENINASVNQMNRNGSAYKSRKKKLERFQGILRCCLSSRTRKNEYGETDSKISDFWQLMKNEEAFNKMAALILCEKLIQCLNQTECTNADFILRCVYVYSHSFPDKYDRNFPLL